MISGKQMETGIIASIFTGTVSTILSAIVLQWIYPPSSGNPNDKPPALENKPTPPKVDPAPRSQAPLGNARPKAPLPVAPRDENREAELRNRAFPNRVWERE